MSIRLLYLTFAIIATVVNLLTQEVIISWQRHDEYIAMMIGTATGLITKYVLDKTFIFKFVATSKSQGIHVFVLYSFMGVATTFIFWGIEWGFYSVYDTHFMRNVGAVIGLSISYLIKYQLDKNYVFASKRAGTWGTSRKNDASKR